MGCFSYICKESGIPVTSTSFDGDAVYMFLLVKGEVVEIMKGHYDSYGRVFDADGNSFTWDMEWGDVVDLMFDGTTENGIAVVLAQYYDGVVPTTASENDPDQGWGKRRTTMTIDSPYHMNSKGVEIRVAEGEEVEEVEEEVDDIRYAIVKLSEINGDHEYDYQQLIQMSADADINEEGDNALMEVVGADAEELDDTGKFWDSSMERLTYLYSIVEITIDEYNVLKKFI